MKTETNTTSLIEDYHLLSYDEIDSTNAEARRLASAGASHGAVIWAKSQTAGKGRMGRDWVSKQGNLFVTFLLSPNKPLDNLAELSFVASYAVLEMLEPIVDGDNQLQLKWPNDVLLNDKKVAGILLESFETETANGDKKTWVSVGVGVNVDSCPSVDDIRFPATCLTSAGVQIISAKIVLSRFIHHFITNYDIWCNQGFLTIKNEWQKHAYKFGKEMQIRHGDDVISGVFESLCDDGAIVLKQKNNETLKLMVGDVLPDMRIMENV